MRKVQGVSIPRSGHHLLVRLLKAYFGESFVYCEHHGTLPSECCKQIPCIWKSVQFSKSHDIGKKGKGNPWKSFPNPIVSNQYYLIQYRYFLDSLISGYNKTIEKTKLSDSKESWLRFSKGRIPYYKNFVSKWILSFRGNPFFLMVPYNKLIESPVLTLAEIIRFFDPTTDVNLNKIVIVIETEKIRSSKSLMEFKYFDFEYFVSIEKQLIYEILSNGWNPRFYSPTFSEQKYIEVGVGNKKSNHKGLRAKAHNNKRGNRRGNK